MKSLRRVLLLISSFLFSSSLATVLSNYLLLKFHFSFFNPSVVAISADTITDKNRDFTQLILSFVFVAIIYYINSKLCEKGKLKTFYLETLLLVVSLFTFLQTQFVNSSLSQILEIIFLTEVIYFAGNFLSWEEYLKTKHTTHEELLIILGNGLFIGFYISLFAIKLLTFDVLPLIILFVFPLLFYVVSKLNNRVKEKILNFPAFILVVAIFFPKEINYLLVLGVLVIIKSYFIFRYKYKIFEKSFVTQFIYPTCLIVLITYSPNFAVGDIDTIEEGYLLSWVQRLIQGQTLYKDVVVFQPPLIIWGLFLWDKVVGFSLYSERLYLHLLQIVGIISFYFISRKLLLKKYTPYLVTILFVSIASSLVRNNVEIRVGIGLLSLLLFFIFLEKKKYLPLFLSGFVSAFSILFSSEVGVVSILTISLSLLFFPRRFVNYFYYIAGLLTLLLPFALFELMHGAFFPMVGQLSFYIQQFSQGYMNLAKERIPVISFLHWHLVDQYFSSVPFLWDLTFFTIVGCLVYFSFEFFSNRKLSIEDRKILVLSLFGLLLFRTALGRSDVYHLLFVLPVALLLFVVLIERLFVTNKILGSISFILLFLFIARPWFEGEFLDNNLLKFQRWGIVGEFKHLNFPRGGDVQIGIERTREIDTLNKMVDYLDKNTNVDDKIFIYPWSPEIYFFTNRQNATMFDTPLSFVSDKYQNQMVDELIHNKPTMIIYRQNFGFGGMGVGTLPKVNDFIQENYTPFETFGDTELLKPKI